MPDLTFKYEVSVTVDPRTWQDATGCRPEPNLREIINDTLRANGLVIDVDVRVREVPIGPPKFEEIL